MSFNLSEPVDCMPLQWPLQHLLMGKKDWDAYNIAVELLEHGADVRARRGSGYSPPVSIAAAHGHCELVKLFIQRGADLDVVDSDGKTALLHAARMGSGECIEMLCKSGANPNLTCPLYGLVMHSLVGSSNEGTWEGIQRGLKVLLQHGADPHQKRNGRSAIMLAQESRSEPTFGSQREILNILRTTKRLGSGDMPESVEQERSGCVVS
jgi:ankyrin repeat protein